MSEEYIYGTTDYGKEDTKKETDKKCPNCGGVMDFDPATGGLLCPYCGHVQQIEQETEVAQTAEELDFDTAEQTGNCDWGAEKKTVTCKSCGAVSIYDELVISNECPYCGSNQVMEEQGANSLAPGGVCVFKVDAKNAGERFKSWIKGRLFCPSEAKKKARPEAFKGVYIPAWTFDADTVSRYRAEYGIRKTYRDSKGNTHTKTDWYSTSGTHREFINDHLVIATDRYDRTIFSAIQPFATEDNLAYKPEYVAGFVSERYTIGLKDSWEKATADIRSHLSGSISSEIERDNRADDVRSLNFTTSYSGIKYKYLLLPVWISSFKYKDKVYNFMVNGQTGKVSGKTPVSPLRVTLAVVLGIFAVIILYKLFGEYTG